MVRLLLLLLAATTQLAAATPLEPLNADMLQLKEAPIAAKHSPFRVGFRRLSAGNSTGAAGGFVTSAIVGTFTVMGGTRIQPVLLLINGFIAAQVGEAFTALLEEFTPANIITLFLRVVSGFSVGTVGIQNMNFQATLQGAVLVACAFQLVRTPLENAIRNGTDGTVEEWLMLAVDTTVATLGSILSLAFMRLFKVLNSAYLSSTMCVNGWVAVIEAGGTDVPAWLETTLIILLTLFCVWWHSLIISMARAEEWKQLSEPPQRVQLKSALRRLVELVVMPIALASKLFTGFSQALGRICNLKALPMTVNQIVEMVMENLNIQSVDMVVSRFLIGIQAMHFTGQVLREKGIEEVRIRQAVSLVGTLCGSLDTDLMRKVLFELQKGTGDITSVLDTCFEDLVREMRRQGDSPKIPCLKTGFIDATLEEVEEIWAEAKEAIVNGTTRCTRGIVLKAVTIYSGVSDAAQKDYIAGLVSQLELQEMIVTMRMVQTGRFSLEDLVELSQQKAAYAAARGVKLMSAKAFEVAEAAGAKARAAADEALEAAVGGADIEAPEAAVPTCIPEVFHLASPPAALSGAAEAALAKSHERSVSKLAEALSDILAIEEAVGKVPILGKAVASIVMRFRKTLDSLLGSVPLVGPKLLELCVHGEQMLRAKILAVGMSKLLQANGVPLATVTKAVQAMAAQDEYLDDVLEELLSPAAAATAAKVAVGGSGRLMDPGGLTGLMLHQARERGPGKCREMLLFALVDLFEIDLEVAEAFVKQLTPKSLMKLGQEVVKGGFDFEACTKQAKLKVEDIIFEAPVDYFEDGLTDAQMTIDFEVNPTVVSVNQEFVNEVVEKMGSQGPRKNDRLIFVGNTATSFMTKEEFDMAVTKIVEKKKFGATSEEVPTLKFKFSRGLQVDFAERFREVMPSVLRRFLGLPFPQGQELARSLTMSQMKRLVCILLMGGIKKLDDLGTEAGVHVNIEMAWKAHVPRLLTIKYGFSPRGAESFTSGLDPSTASFLVRLKQMLGVGELEAMSYVLAFDDVDKLDKIHKRRFKPRIDISRLLPEDPRQEEDTKVSLAVNDQGKFKLWKNGQPLGDVQTETVETVLAIWREMQERHLDPDRELVGDVPKWSSEEPVRKLQENKTLAAEMRMAKHFFKWPEMVIEKAGLDDSDADVASKLFLEAIEEARESVWAKYERLIMGQACVSLGAPDAPSAGKVADTESAEVEQAQVARRIEERKKAAQEVRGWMNEVFARLPPPGPKRGPALKQVQELLKERDTFRLQKFAGKRGVATPLPLEGLQAQLREELATLPFDITANANELSEFLTKSKHPLTGRMAKAVTHKAPAGAAAGKRQFQPEAMHGVPPPACGGHTGFGVVAPPSCSDTEAGTHGEGVVLLSAAARGEVEPETLAAAPKMKELFKLSQAGGFGVLGKFVAAFVPGGTEEVSRNLRNSLSKRLRSSFPTISDTEAMVVVESFLPTSYSTMMATKVMTEDGLDEIPPSSIPEVDARDGEAISKGVRVAVAEEVGSLARLARPQRGWVRMEELKPLEINRSNDPQGVMEIAAVVRSVKKYLLEELQDMSDKADWGLDFQQLARERIILAVRKWSSAFAEATIKKAIRNKKEADLAAVLKALDSRDVRFVIDSLGLKRTATTQKPKPELRKAKSKEVRDLEKLVRELQQKLKAEEEKHSVWGRRLEAHCGQLERRAQRSPEMREVRDQVPGLY